YPQLLDRADQGIDLDRATRLDVLQRGGLVFADLLGTGNALFERHAESRAEFLADRLRLAHHVAGELARGRILADIDQCRMRQRADRVEAQVAPELEPDFRADVVQHRRLETRSSHDFRDLLHTLGLGAIELADREAVALDVLDHARGDDLARG